MCGAKGALQSAISVDGEPVALLARMSVSVEIRLVGFFLSPFFRHARESFCER